ncbi:gene transfer agent family protein [Bradyrhizobium sp. CB2312]|uniref:gene transfer agent family protein n=1 Tax=Bradyrhizobium sp. CB2312 TaxID=3039155 RepID=UPI0024B1AED5|nr:gene transfer agent family protein [Bradyrhizobium sp. CB2312]WFU76594.1 gene transfer agent family protein [Bradyrhizobium sp. CB2312]
MTMTAYTIFFGDGEHAFKLTPAVIGELETKCGSGIGMIANRLFSRNFAQADVTETIRLALIGAGTPPKRAHEFIVAYVDGRPLIETYELAAKILERVLFGNPSETKGT